MCFCYSPIMLMDTANYDGTNLEWEDRNIRSATVTFGRVRYQPGGYCGPRIQHDYQLVWIHSGTCTLRVDQSVQTLTVGRVCLLTPGHNEYFIFDETTQTHHFWCSVAPAFLPPALRKKLKTCALTMHRPSECFARLVSSAFLLRTTPSSAAQGVVEALALALFYEFLNMAEMALNKDQSDAYVVRALRYMEDHLGEPSCLAGAQHASGCSVNALIYKFRAALGTTPCQYLWQLRTEKGVSLLADTGLSIAEIADQCGFKNPFHFSRRVHRLQNVSPRELRHRAWSHQSSNHDH